MSISQCHSVIHVHPLKRTVVQLVILLLPVSLGVTSADGAPFRIQDYIPEYFRDTEWRVSGSLNARGSDVTDESRNRIAIPDIGELSESRKNRDDRFEFTGATSFLFRYETIPSYWQAGVDARATLLNSSYGYTDTRQSLNHYRRSTNDFDSRRNDLRLTPHVTTGHYLFDDFLFSLSARASSRYVEEPDSQQDRFEESEEHQSGGHVSRRIRDYHSDGYEDSKTHDVQVSLRPGWGRIYEGQYASTAMYVVDELEKHALLAAQPSSSQMVQLSEIIHQNRRTHAIDTRLSDIDAMQAISGYLIAEGILSEPSSQADFLIQDVWRYFPMRSRRFGFRLHAGVGYSHQYKSTQESQAEHDQYIWLHHDEDTPSEIDTTRTSSSSRSYEHGTMEERSPYFLIELDYHRPINLRWQADAYAIFMAYFNSDLESTGYRTQTSDDESSTGRARTAADAKRYRRVNMSGVLSYIPTSRTEVSLSGAFNHSRANYDQRNYLTGILADDQEVQTMFALKYWSATFGLRASYRISIPTRLSVGVELDGYGNSQDGANSDQERDRVSYQVWAGVTHYIR